MSVPSGRATEGLTDRRGLLTRFDDYNKLIVEDTFVDDAPIMACTVLSTGDFKLTVTLFECSASTCYSLPIGTYSAGSASPKRSHAQYPNRCMVREPYTLPISSRMTLPPGSVNHDAW